MESKEQHALSPQNISPITVCAGVDGIVLNVQQQAGDYVVEGNAVCTIADVNSYVFLLNVPYEQAQYVTAGNTCELLFPDGSRISAMTYNPLPEANTTSQTLAVIVRAPKAPILPEGVKVDAKLYTSQPKSNVMVLPKKAVQCSEDLTCCWVMKLINDSTAVRIPVNTGHSNTDSIEVIGNLSPADRIVLTGAYALPDSSKITISHE